MAGHPRLVIGAWEVRQEIGRGAFATVYRGCNTRTGQQVAVKEINTDKLNAKLKQSLESEVTILRRIAHQNIVQLYDVLEERGQMYLIMEFCAGGDLAAYIRQHLEVKERRGTYGVSEAVARALMLQLAAGLRAMWTLNLVHRDLKPQNLLLSCEGPGAVLKIADFGFARNLQPQGMAVTMCGSPLYMAPEILQNRQYDSKADLWSVGTILYELLVGRPPFNAPNHFMLVRQIQTQEVRLPDRLSGVLSASCVSLITGLLKKNPVERISFEEFFNHPFLNTSGTAVSSPPAKPAASTDSMSSCQSVQTGFADRPPLPQRGVTSTDASSGRGRGVRSRTPPEEMLPFAVDEWVGGGRTVTMDEPQYGGSAPGSTRIRATLVTPPSTRFAPLYGSPGQNLRPGNRLAERATSLPGRLTPSSAQPQEDEDEGYVIISREATASPSTSSHGSFFPGSSYSSLVNSGSSATQARMMRAHIQSSAPPAARHHAAPPPSSPIPPTAPFLRAQTLPPRPHDAASAGGVALSWASAGHVDRLEGLRRVCHAMEALAIEATHRGGNGGGRPAALALRLMALQILDVALEQELGAPNADQTLLIHDMRVITERAEQMKPEGMDEGATLPDVWELVYRGALAMAKEASSKEFLSDFGSSRKLYEKAGALMYFMLAEAPNLALKPSLELRAEDRTRLLQYNSQIRMRYAACTAVIDAAAQQTLTAAVL